MTRICLIGPVDKRSIMYPLMKVLDALGRTLVITDDSNLRRLSEDYSLEFSLGQMEVVINSDWDYLKGLSTEGFENVLYVTTNEVIPDVNRILCCYSDNRSIATSDVLDVLEGIDHDEVLIISKKLKKSSKFFISLDQKCWDYIWGCEEYKQLKPCSNVLNEKVSRLFGDCLSINGAEISKILSRAEEMK